MFQAKTRMRTLLLVLTYALSSSACDAAAKCQPLQIEAVPYLTIQQLGQLADKQAVTTHEYAAVFWGFDSEDRPRKGELQAIGFILISTGDIDAKPFGALVWSSQAIAPKLRTNSAGGFEIIDGGQTTSCTKALLDVRVHQDGSVILDDKIIGRVE